MCILIEKTWKEFAEAPGILEAMDKVFKETGWTIQLTFDDDTGEIIKAAPMKKQ